LSGYYYFYIICDFLVIFCHIINFFIFWTRHKSIKTEAHKAYFMVFFILWFNKYKNLYVNYKKNLFAENLNII
jgi:hypothetical protein